MMSNENAKLIDPIYLSHKMLKQSGYELEFYSIFEDGNVIGCSSVFYKLQLVNRNTKKYRRSARCYYYIIKNGESSIRAMDLSPDMELAQDACFNKIDNESDILAVFFDKTKQSCEVFVKNGCVIDAYFCEAKDGKVVSFVKIEEVCIEKITQKYLSLW